MGIKKGFMSYIKKKYPSIIKEGFITDFTGKKIVIDIFSFLYRYIHSFGKDDNKWIGAMFKHFLVFKKYNIDIIPVFDGKPPPEKYEERVYRKEKKEQEDNKLNQLIEDFSKYLETKEVTENLDHVNNMLLKKKQQISMFKSKLFKNNNRPKIDTYEIENYINTCKNRCNYLSKSDIQLVKELFTHLKIPYIQAVDEAETLACFLLKNNLCDSVISLDSDCIAYGVDNFLIDINQRGQYTQFDVNELCRNTGLTKSQVTDLCIICQCDYNSVGNGFEGVGPAKAINLLKQYQNIEGIIVQGYKEDQLNFQRCRDIFSSEYPDYVDIVNGLVFSNEVNLDEIKNFLEEKDIPINMRDIQMTWVS